MKEFVNWLVTLDWSVIATTLISMATVWGGSIIALVVGIIKTRASKLNLEKALAEIGIELEEKQAERMEEMKEALISKLGEAIDDLMLRQDNIAQERMEAITQLTQDAEEFKAELEKEYEDYTKGLN